ncbi:hypothetical protein J4457_03875 [Candidatus Woesearchaeota archaeon]|nr:hypothetical protein [Candidatus Woesearchaeota archaeon]
MRVIHIITLFIILFFLLACSKKESQISIQEGSEISEKSIGEQKTIPEVAEVEQKEQEKTEEQSSLIQIENKSYAIVAPPMPKNAREIINGHVFMYEKERKVWRTELPWKNLLLNMTFRYNPEEVRGIPILGALNATFNLKNIFITFDPVNTLDTEYVALAAHELSMHLASSFDRSPVPACTQVNKDCPEQMLVTCNAANKAVIFLDSTPEQKITLKGNCLHIAGQGEDLVKATERMIFDWYGLYK